MWLLMCPIADEGASSGYRVASLFVMSSCLLILGSKEWTANGESKVQVVFCSSNKMNQPQTQHKLVHTVGCSASACTFLCMHKKVVTLALSQVLVLIHTQMNNKRANNSAN